MITLLLATAWGAQPLSFRPNPNAPAIEVRADNTLVGHPGRVRQAVVVSADDYDAIEALPDVLRVDVGPTGRLARVFPVPGVHSVSLSSQLEARSDVLWAHPDVEVRAHARVIPNDPWLGDQWHLINTGQRGYYPGSDINAEEAWTVTHGAGMMVAIVDSGTDVNHPDLLVTPGWDYVDDDADSHPTGGEAHGTAVGGLAAGIGNNGIGTAGVAYEGELYGIRMIGGYTSMYDVYLAFVEATDAGAAVINNSWGFEEDCANMPLYSELENAVDYAEEQGRDGHGTAVVFSAGNGNCDITNDGLLGHPAVIGVAAIDGYDLKEGYSSWGPWVDISAPGSRIATTDIVGNRGYENGSYTDTFSGTSAAAPIISGVMALIFAANERISAEQARQVLCDTAVRIDPSRAGYDAEGWSPYYGCGRADAGAAVKAAYNAGPPGVPQIVSTTGLVGPGPVTLKWNKPDDPDGDSLTYRVRWWPTPKPFRAKRQDVEGRSFTFDEPFEIGDDITWKILAEDQYGAGEWSEEVSFQVVDPATLEPAEIEATGGCNTVSQGGALGWLAVLVPLLAVRRRDGAV